MRTMPASYDCRAFGFKDGQSGLFYDYSLNTLLRGTIVNFMLSAEVVHDGTDKARYRFFASYEKGYKHDDWDLQYITWFPDDILTFDGYKAWLEDESVTEREIRAFIKARRLLEETIDTN